MLEFKCNRRARPERHATCVVGQANSQFCCVWAYRYFWRNRTRPSGWLCARSDPRPCSTTCVNCAITLADVPPGRQPVIARLNGRCVSSGKRCSVLWMILSDTLRLVGGGVLLGCLMLFLVVRFVRDMLYGVSAFDA